MRIPVLTLTATLALAGCSSTGGGKLAVCDGKHLRPANPHGTVLAAPASAADAKLKNLSSVGSPAAFGSCRG
jgi:hypothetical protein